MRRKLPSRPNLEHLKSQAKDLLDAQRRRDPKAFERIRAALPAFANQPDAAIATGSFALHDAQSAIAREYGFVSWAQLRATISAGHDAEASAVIQALSGQKLMPELQAAVRDALLRRSSGEGAPTPGEVPLLALRNSLLFPGTLIPLDVARPSTLKAIEAALKAEPAFLAVFAQRSFQTESPSAEELHPVGCLCIVQYFHRTEGGGQAWTLVEGVRWVTLEALDQVDPYCVARVTDAGVERGDEGEIDALGRKLRETARKVADALPEIREPALALIDETEDIAQLADLVMANFPGEVDGLASYANETRLARRLEHVIARLDVELAQALPAPH